MLLGAHMSIAGGVYHAPYHGKNATCDTVQIFTKQSNQWRAKPLTDEDVERFLTAQKETGVTVSCAHNSYLINLASPNEELYEKSYGSMKQEIERCDMLKVPVIVMHPGSHVGSGEEAGLKRIANALNRIFSSLPDSTTVVLLETTSGQGSNLGYKFEQLAAIIDMIEDKKRIGVCLDSCHIFSAGYPLQSPKDYRATMKQFNEIIGLKRLRIIHFNDSKKPFGERKDRHEHIGKGEMGLEPFRHIMNDRRLNRVPKILETPKGDDLKEDIENLKVLRSLITKA
ncbi:MAG: deoxyribonuclease IV [Candidatus Zixiibacteriota bacterium]|nr:MAG: deoxyribonuclease IV [candidate division Zixibacteria bacterium]